MRRQFLIVSIVLMVALAALSWVWPPVLWSLLVFGPLLAAGYQDYFQQRQAIRRNFPILGRFRYLFEAIRPEINQYFVESNTDGRPFSRDERSVVYQRAKDTLDTVPFGTRLDVYQPGYEWMNHSLAPLHVDPATLRVTIGGPACTQPYDASLLNISAMSYGSLSGNAIRALNGGARDGGFAHNTGEGGISPHHLANGGDLIWQIGTGYFGCRNADGGFDPELFAKNASRPEVKMIELKLSQGAKPGHGGILPAAKVTPEIAAIRHVPLGKDVLSPPGHSAFSTPVEMMHFLATMRELSGGKPVGFKLCLGKRREFLALCKAMVATGVTPDYIAVDGGEGGTGAAPVEFTNRVGSPAVEAIAFVHNALVGFGVRDRVRVLAAGRITTGFGVLKALMLGADLVYSARGMMLALGCIQALRCNANVCPTGVATQDPHLEAGLVVTDKRRRVASFHRETLASVAELLGAMGLSSTRQLRPWHLMRRVSPTEVRHYGELFHYLQSGDLLGDDPPADYARALRAASAHTFASTSDDPIPV
ncbi:MAG: FMN-binding glutamate synthase family protein [Planctomycetes bacterium]|nr:FMN-binding glutamate synthase family protein [Planctomycetota bacterium]